MTETLSADIISRNVSPQNPRNPSQISSSYLVTHPLCSPAECKHFFNAHFADAPPPPEQREGGSVVLEGGVGGVGRRKEGVEWRGRGGSSVFCLVDSAAVFGFLSSLAPPK